ncbi:MAG: N-acetylneuraminate synthase family protein [Planctomycetota bacterium]
MRIGNREIGTSEPPYIIAEIGVNHDGSGTRAAELVDAAAAAGADAVKLQLFRTDLLLSANARLAAYQAQSGATDPISMLRELELDIDQIRGVFAHARERELHGILTVFSLEQVADAASLDCDAYKTASSDLINKPLIEAMMATRKPLLLSTGASTLEEVERTVTWLRGHEFLLMQCVSAYPAPDDQAALGGRSAMRILTPRARGYSDHTTAVDTGALAVAAGASVLEKHITYDRTAPGPDHAASLDPHYFETYVRAAHRAWRMRGPAKKQLLEIERDVRQVSRQSLTVTRDLRAGHVLTRADLTIKRPGTGLEPFRLDATIGRRLAQAVEADHVLTEADLAAAK